MNNYCRNRPVLPHFKLFDALLQVVKTKSKNVKTSAYKLCRISWQFDSDCDKRGGQILTKNIFWLPWLYVFLSISMVGNGEIIHVWTSFLKYRGFRVFFLFWRKHRISMSNINNRNMLFAKIRETCLSELENTLQRLKMRFHKFQSFR